ncbi:hypothetical protein ACM26V_17425 [Salipaludibacillus sp. HK11]|uniref:hypothetical protein n=1 Tax=Salipaludibacillus sp. HK11 TaxID=3394320 RepID=UPI0039FD863F
MPYRVKIARKLALYDQGEDRNITNSYTLTVDGNIYFASDEFEASAELSNNSEVTGSVEVQ